VSTRRRILLIQLPIPQPGQEPAVGNVPLAAGYLQLLARQRGLESQYEIEILPPPLANQLSDQGLAAEILRREPWLVGWTCYLWNVERSLDMARRVKQVRPEVRMLLGGPEITADNLWVLQSPEVDFAAIGEGEQTFCELLQALAEADVPAATIPGLYVSPALDRTRGGAWSDEPVALGPIPPFRQPLPHLNEISSPYLAGILDAADERLLLLETLRGCVFKCKFCYYPKSYDDLYFLSRDKIIANLDHARRHGAREVVLLDPTLNQRRDFDTFLQLLAECNPERQFEYFGELRAEGVTPRTAELLRAAHFTQVEIGLQSIDPLAQDLMDRKNNLKAFERGVRALREVGISVKVDLIIGLPGDTVASVRRSLHWLRDSQLFDEVQVFNLAILPGTAFRQEAASLGLEHQPRPPYYVLRTPTLELTDLYLLMDEAQDLFETEFDPLPEVTLPSEPAREIFPGVFASHRIDLDHEADCLPPPTARTQAFTLWLAAHDLARHTPRVCQLVATLLADNPHTTLQVVLEPGDPATVTVELLSALRLSCYRQTTYLDRFYSILPGPMKGSKRLVVLLPAEVLDRPELEPLEEFATLVSADHIAAAAGVPSEPST
jgi:radical SAM superfamily enzyme YgiQ (UPF0313 family)